MNVAERPDDKSASSDCYSAGERGWMELGQQLRARWLHPALVQLTRLQITPDLITLSAVCIGLAFVPSWLIGSKLVAIVCLLVHVLLDGLDGPLARYQGNASSRGSFTDTLADQCVVTGVMIAWMVGDSGGTHVFAGALYIFLYALVVAMAMVRNALKAPYSWLVRPRLFVYATIGIDYWFTTHWTLWILIACNVLLALKALSGFLRLRRELPGPQPSE